MALKLGKCRLCLKLGDFYSIFTTDNAMQLSEMAMDCTRIKIYEGDGLPDKICSECIQKLSSAYIFKQQCERSDMELRRNYVPPPGFSITPPPQNRQSSDSAFSSANTDLSYKPASTEKVTPANRSRKRSHESVDESISSRSHDYRPTSSKRVEELRTTKRPRNQSPNASIDSDFEDNSYSHFSAETDSDEPLMHSVKCKICSKEYKNSLSLRNHMRVHTKVKPADVSMGDDASSIPRKSLEDAKDSEDKLSCEKCNKTFKLKIMLKRHAETCGKSPKISKELLISLEPIDAVLPSKPVDPSKKIDCEMCTTKFKTYDNLEKHMRVCHAAVPKKPRPSLNNSVNKEKPQVPCLYCKEIYEDFKEYTSHFNSCPKKNDCLPFQCPQCEKVMAKRHTFLSHVKQIHFFISNFKDTPTKSFDCRMCSMKLATQEQLITHLGTHMSHYEDQDDQEVEDNYVEVENTSRASTPDDVMSNNSDYTNSTVSSGPYKCDHCDKYFKYKKAFESHLLAKHNVNTVVQVKTEPPDKPSTSQEEMYREYDDDSSPGEGDDLTCEICEKQFSYKRLLIHHKKTKHHMSSGHKRAKINLKDCTVRCLICDVEMKVSSINEHNQKHISVNVRPRNLYTCGECSEQFKSCSALATHIKLIHRLKQQPQQPQQFEGADLADFCEVVVTKTEPLDEVQSHNGFVEVPLTSGGPVVDLAGFNCHLCGKTMRTLLALRRHVNWHANVGAALEKNLECFVCKEKFRFQCHYRLHMRAHYTDPQLDPALLTCAVCGRRSKHLRAARAHMNFHKQTRFKNKDYQCSICKRIFQYRKVYLSHMAIHYKRGDGQNTIVGDRPTQSGQPADGTHTCPQCGKVCDSENSLKCHVRWHSSKSSLFGSRHECTICHLQFTNKRRLEIHTRDHYEDENGPYKCTVCGKGYIDEEYFRRHVKGHNFDHQVHKKRIEKLRKGKVKCPICARYYPDVVKLIRHLKRTHPESKMIKTDPDAPPQQYFSCKLCAKVFLTERRLQHHEGSHLRKHEFIKCKFCGLKSHTLQKHRLHVKQKHLTQKYLDNPLKCPHCTETFIRGYLLHHHIRDVHDIDEEWIADRTEEPLGPLKELQCSICLKVLASKGNFERHIDYHNSLSCNYCFEYFGSLKFLEGHLAFSCEKRRLIGDTEPHPKKVKCHICYKAFHLQVKLDCHLRTQHNIKVWREASEGKQEITCDYCFRVFENEYALGQHKIYHRTVGYYGCIYCNKKFNSLVTYNRHKKMHFYKLYPDNPVKCEHCDETFVAFRDMIDHMKDVHGDDKEWFISPKESIEEKCPICNKVFFNLQRHLVYHEENRCKKCGEYFYSRVECDNHLCAIESEDEVNEDNENDIRPKYEECTFCFKPITKKVTKKAHDNLHRVSGAISCRFCTLKFKTIDAFNIHAFSHRSRKYHKKPIKCRICKEKFVKYGPFIKHMKGVHKTTKKVHYRAIVKAERCVVCGDSFPNLHNHYRSHLLNQCQQCLKYFTSVKLFNQHECDKEDSDPSKVFTSDENLTALIKSYTPKDEKDDEKYYGYTDDEEEEEETQNGLDNHNDESQNSLDPNNPILQPFVISDVLSLYEKKEELLAIYQQQDPKNKELSPKKRSSKKKEKPKAVETPKEVDSDIELIDLLDDDSTGLENNCPVITIDDDD